MYRWHVPIGGFTGALADELAGTLAGMLADGLACMLADGLANILACNLVAVVSARIVSRSRITGNLCAIMFTNAMTPAGTG